MTVKRILAELVSWRSRPSQRERLRARPLDKEIPNPIPVALPIGYEAPPTMEDMIRMYVRHEVSQAASDQGLGTFEEEDDFSEDEQNPLPFPDYDVNEYDMENDPDMPETAPVEDPPTAPADPSESPLGKVEESTAKETGSAAIPLSREGTMLTGK